MTTKVPPPHFGFKSKVVEIGWRTILICYMSAGAISSSLFFLRTKNWRETRLMRRWITKYAESENMFFEDFKNSYIKMVNSGARWKNSWYWWASNILLSFLVRLQVLFLVFTELLYGEHMVKSNVPDTNKGYLSDL